MLWKFTGAYNGFPAYGPNNGANVDVLGVSQFLIQSGRIVQEVRLFDEIALRTQIYSYGSGERDRHRQHLLSPTALSHHTTRKEVPAMTTDVLVEAGELERRTVRRTDWVSSNTAFIDCRTPGSDRKDNYAFIGPGVSQSSDQFVNLTELHGFNVGAAGMPNGVTNNLHLHFTAEVFINFGGTFRVRWGVDGKQGEYISQRRRHHLGADLDLPRLHQRGPRRRHPAHLPRAGRDRRHHLGTVGAPRRREARAAADRRQPADRHRRR